MGIESLGDIANVLFSQTITWETATDWDNAVSDAGVVHEGYLGRQANRIELGYPSVDRGGTSLLAFWPLTETSGTTFVEQANAHDLSVSGVALNNTTGPFGQPAATWDGADDYARISSTGSWLPTDGITFSWWQQVDGNDTNHRSVVFWKSGSGNRINVHAPWDSYDTLFWDWGDLNGGGRLTTGWDTAWTNSWIHVAVTSSTSNGQQIFVNGTPAQNTDSDGDALDNTVTADFDVGKYGQRSDGSFPGEIAQLRFYDRVLSSSEVQALYDTGSGGNLTTASKSFSTAVKPDLQDLVYSLNGQSITLDVIGSPATASEETVSQSLGGSASYSLTWSNSHTDFRVKPKLSTTDTTTAPTVNAITLST
jgi:hypothetical protein